jgi:hypothetical protein
MPKKPTTAAKLKETQQQIELHKAQEELRALTQSTGTALMEGWGDIVDRREAYAWGNEPAGLPYPSMVSRDDFQWGRFRPVYEHEQHLAEMWATARYLANCDAAGAGMMRALTDYTIGTGMTYELESLSGEGVAGLQAFLDDWQEDIGWTGELERELFSTTETHGDGFPWLQPRGQRMPRLTLLAPEWICEPSDKGIVDDWVGMDWHFGVVSQPNRSWEVEGYFASINGSAGDYEPIDCKSLPHIKRNAPTWAKRGVSTYYPAMKLLEKASKLLGNTLDGGSIQAAIAFIEEHAPGVTQTQAQSLQSGNATTTSTRSTATGGSATTYQRRFLPGTVLSTSNGKKYHAGPMGTPAGPLFVEIVQAGLRLAGARLGMPEYMISGDASNANYASTLVAGSPFVKSIEHLQSIYVSAFKRLTWRALQFAAMTHQLAKFGIYHCDDLKQAVKLTVTPTQVVMGDPKAQEDIRAIRLDKGILSKRTYAAQVDLDYDAEQANIEQEPKPEPPPMFGQPPFGQRPGFPPQARQVKESWFNKL